MPPLDIRPGIRRLFRLAVRRPDHTRTGVDEEILLHLRLPSTRRARLHASAARREDRMRLREWLDDLRHDLRLGLRAALRAPRFSLLAVVTLALGIGANAAVFGVVKSVLLDAMPYASADRLVRVYMRFRDGTSERGPISAATFTDVVARSRSFSHAAAFNALPTTGVLVGDGEPRVVRLASVQPALFPTLGVAAAVGRTLREDDVADTARTVVLTYGGWQTLFAGDAGVVGTAVRVNGVTRTVVGILPPRFVGPVGDVDFYVPLSLAPTLRDPVAARASGWLGMVGRLRAGVTPDAARRELVAIGDALSREHPRDDANRALHAMPIRDAMVGDTRTPLLVLTAGAGLVLLITCANLAGALLARAIARRREFAVRTALGAGRGRLVRQLLAESTVLALAGGAAGVLVGAGGLALLRGLAAHALPAYAELRLDAGAVLVTSLLALATGLAFGIVPALAVGRADPQSALREESRGASEGRRARRLRGVLVAGQIALCVSLLAGAGLLVASLAAMTSAPLGFRPDGVLTAVVQLADARFDAHDARVRFFTQLEERLRALPGVTAVADVSALPTAVLQRNEVAVVGAAPPAGGAAPFVLAAAVSDGYFGTLGIPLQEGRAFGPEDRGGPPTIVISRAMARTFWPRGGALGGQVRVGPDPNRAPYTVVGIVGDVRNDPARPEAEPITYISNGVMAVRTRTLAVRTGGDPLALLTPVRRALAGVDPGVPMRDAAPLAAFLADRLTARRLPVALMGAFGALALLLASVGVYAMFAALVAAREREFAVRVALGAAPAGIAALVLREGVVWMAAGLAVGAAGVAVVGRLVQGLLYGVRPFDPLVLGGALAALLVCATVALLAPVRRATQVDATATLR